MWTCVYGFVVLVQLAASFPVPSHNATSRFPAPEGDGIFDLIMKIAEHPNAWQKIHRILETLEANKLAYGMQKSSHAVGTSFVNSTTAGMGLSESSSDPVPIFMHPQWQFLTSSDHLSAIEALNHPHRFDSRKTVNDTTPESPQKKKTFEQSLHEIEEELHEWAKATKPKQRVPSHHAHNKTRAKIKLKHKLVEKAWQNWKKNKTSSLRTHEKKLNHQSVSPIFPTFSTTHPRFVYHRVIANTNQLSPLKPSKARAAYLAIAIPPKSNSSQRVTSHK